MWATFERFEIQMTRSQAASVSGQGQQLDNVRALLRVPTIARQFDVTGPRRHPTNPRNLTAENIRAELDEYGAWDESELTDDQTNRERIVWIAGCNITEELGQPRVRSIYPSKGTK